MENRGGERETTVSERHDGEGSDSRERGWPGKEATSRSRPGPVKSVSKGFFSVVCAIQSTAKRRKAVVDEMGRSAGSQAGAEDIGHRMGGSLAVEGAPLASGIAGYCCCGRSRTWKRAGGGKEHKERGAKCKSQESWSTANASFIRCEHVDSSDRRMRQA